MPSFRIGRAAARGHVPPDPRKVVGGQHPLSHREEDGARPGQAAPCGGGERMDHVQPMAVVGEGVAVDKALQNLAQHLRRAPCRGAPLRYDLGDVLDLVLGPASPRHGGK